MISGSLASDVKLWRLDSSTPLRSFPGSGTRISMQMRFGEGFKGSYIPVGNSETRMWNVGPQRD